jgi:hypothetical protein
MISSLLSYLQYVSVLPVAVPACIADSRYVRHVCQPPGAGPCLRVLLAAPRGAVDIYVSLCFGSISLLPVTRFWSKPFMSFIYPPVSPLMSRVPMSAP